MFEAVVSNGILNNIEILSQAERANFSGNLGETINSFSSMNEATALAINLPSGSVTYLGTAAAEVVDAGFTSLLAGDLTLRANFQTSAFEGSISGIIGYPVNYVREDVVITGEILLNGSILGPDMEGSLSGVLNDGVENFGASGTLNGAFSGDGATGVLGTFEGSLGNTSVNGIFVGQN